MVKSTGGASNERLPAVRDSVFQRRIHLYQLGANTGNSQGFSLAGMRTGYFPGWVMDGDFFGGGGVVTPVDCPRSDHDHLAGDSTNAYERALTELTATVRSFKPNAYIFMCRPPMDLGVFYQRNVDAVFTIDEMAKPQALPVLANQPVNVMLGDKVRKWSHIRVHHHFFPHYIDSRRCSWVPRAWAAPAASGRANPLIM